MLKIFSSRGFLKFFQNLIVKAVFKIENKSTRMKLINFMNKAWPRACALIVLTLFTASLSAQDSAYSSTRSAANSDRWYNQGWIWFVIIIVAIVVVLAMSRKSDKGTTGRDHNRFKVKR